MFFRLKNILSGILSLFIKDLERQNPEALLELEQENLRKQIGSFNQGLAAHAGLAERRGERLALTDAGFDVHSAIAALLM